MIGAAPRFLRRLRGAVLTAVAAAASPAAAERLVLSLSSHEVAIGSNYIGTQLVVFGVVERDSQSVARPGGYDVIVTVTGPRESLTVRRKQELGPIWLNRDQQKFVSVPSLLGVYASRPLPDLLDLTLRRRLRLGVESVVQAPEFTMDRGVADDPFRAALVRLKARDRLYTETGRGAVFVTPDFFRAPVTLPAVAPTGNYEVEASLVGGGVVLARRSASFELVKAGIEEQITEIARRNALLYGLATAAAALLFGWIASVIFRRD